MKKKGSTAKLAGESWQVTVFLMKEEVATWKDALTKGEGTPSAPPHEDLPGIGTLVIKAAPEKVPWWVERLGIHSKQVKALRQRSPGAVLFISAAQRLFALTFGYGRSLLAPDKIVHDFGIRAVLNTVSPSELRSLDLRTLEAEPLLSRKQFGEGRPLASFGVDTYRDLLRGVAGRPAQGVPILSGSDALHLRMHLTGLTSIGAECEKLLAMSEGTSYRTNFAWIDHVRLVRDSSVRDKLGAALYKACGRKKVDESIRFLVADIVDSEQLESVRGSWMRSSEASLRTADVRSRLVVHAKKAKDAKGFIDKLKQDRVGMPSPETGEFLRAWPLVDCVLWNVEHAKRRYVLHGGDWFQLDGDFVAAVAARFAELTNDSSALALPPAKPIKIPKKSYYEQEYNKNVAKKLGLQNLDRTSMTTGVASSGVEPCDILDPAKGIFAHVKDGRNSSVLSHMFSQGTVGLDTFMSVAEARARVRTLAKVPEKGKGPLHDPVAGGRLTVVFAVIDKPPKNGTWTLPFFSMLAAQQAAERIGRHQAKVVVARIDDQR
jgi:uncharacterized protein (TIGR04141 family)